MSVKGEREVHTDFRSIGLDFRDKDMSAIIPLDVAFFSIHSDFEQMSLPRARAAETRECHMISSEKLMATIAWNREEFHVIAVLPK
jgi:hypothetical protein